MEAEPAAAAGDGGAAKRRRGGGALDPTAAEVRGDGAALVGQAVAGRGEQDRVRHHGLRRERRQGQSQLNT